MSPKVSILLPNLNNRQFLEERLESIANQTFTDWELVIVDNYSDDGAWELFQEWAKKDERIRISQAPRKGIYANWNNCIKLARGEYIYIATSDDTMRPECIETMVNGLDSYPECDICHSNLIIIDEKGEEISGRWEKYGPQRYFGDLTNKWHIRYAPLSGILHFALSSVHISITQVLIRRKAFEKVGLFPTQWGSAGDFEWHMRATLVCNVLHIPQYLATWRIHSDQLTQNTTNKENREKLIEMTASALPILQEYDNDMYSKLKDDWQKLVSFYIEEILLYSLRRGKQTNSDSRLSQIKKYFKRNPAITLRTLYHYLMKTKIKRKKIRFIANYIESSGLQNTIRIISPPDKYEK